MSSIPKRAFQEFLSSHDARVEYWRMKKELFREIKDAKPNTSHVALAGLEKMGELACLMTQNIDGLHQDSGSTHVIELHGTNRKAKLQPIIPTGGLYSIISRRKPQSEHSTASGFTGEPHAGHLPPSRMSFDALTSGWIIMKCSSTSSFALSASDADTSSGKSVNRTAHVLTAAHGRFDLAMSVGTFRNMDFRPVVHFYSVMNERSVAFSACRIYRHPAFFTCVCCHFKALLRKM